MTEDETVSLYDEDLAIRAALERWDDFPFLGGILKVDDEIVAYTIAEELDSRTLDIRFEKAFGELRRKLSGHQSALPQKPGSRIRLGQPGGGHGRGGAPRRQAVLRPDGHAEEV